MEHQYVYRVLAKVEVDHLVQASASVENDKVGFQEMPQCCRQGFLFLDCLFAISHRLIVFITLAPVSPIWVDCEDEEPRSLKVIGIEVD